MRVCLREPRRRLAQILIVMMVVLAGCSSNARRLLDEEETNWRKARYPEAIQAGDSLYELDPHGAYAARALLTIGNIYYLNLRKIKEAIETYDKLIQEFPDSAETLQARRQLAAIYANEVIDHDQAIAQYDRLLEAKNLEDRAQILFERADEYFKKGEDYRALRELHSLEDAGISGHLADEVSLKIGNIYQLQRNYDEAIDAFQKVLAAGRPECRRRAILNLEETYESLFQLDKAIDTIRLLENSPEDEAYVRREVARLSNKRKRDGTGGAVGLNASKLMPGAAPKAPSGTRKRPL